MHVSPFFGMDQTYRFSFTEPGERVHAGVGHPRGRRAPLLGRADRAAAPAHQRRGGPGADAVSPHVPAGDRPHPLAGGEARDEEGARSTTSRGSSPGRARRTAVRAGRCAGLAPARARPLPPARRSPLTPLARRAALWALRHPARGRISVRLPDGTVRRGGDPATGPGRRGDGGLQEPVAAARHARPPGRGRVVRRRRLVDATTWSALLETLAVTAEDARHRFPGSRAHRAPAPPAAAAPPPRTCAGARRDIAVPLRPRQRPLRAVPRPDVDLLVRGVRAAGDVARRRPRRPSTGASARSSAWTATRHVLEIGCGWGGFALHAAREFGARVTGADAVAGAGRAGARAHRGGRPGGPHRRSGCRTTAPLEGRFSHIASIEMLEAIGHRAAAGLLRGARPPARARRRRLRPDDRGARPALRALPPRRRLDPRVHLPRAR